jgi:FKBP-type peptidyl-prolyl cis-trans isomerase FkpA
MTRYVITLLLLALTSQISTAADNAPKSEEQKTLYAVGLIVARQLSVFNLTPAELEIVKQGIMDSATGNKPEVDISAYNEKVQELARARRKAQGEKVAAANKDFLEKAAKEKGAVKTASGLIYQSISEGSGAVPDSKDTVKVNYSGTLPDGKEFDSSYKRGKPFEFKLESVIKCWSEGVQKMKVGGKAKLICPPELAYGDTGAGDLILPGATLVFEIELLETKK